MKHNNLHWYNNCFVSDYNGSEIQTIFHSHSYIPIHSRSPANIYSECVSLAPLLHLCVLLSEQTKNVGLGSTLILSTKIDWQFLP